LAVLVRRLESFNKCQIFIFDAIFKSELARSPAPMDNEARRGIECGCIDDGLAPNEGGQMPAVAPALGQDFEIRGRRRRDAGLEAEIERHQF
jgi:hypothetical protein